MPAVSLTHSQSRLGLAKVLLFVICLLPLARAGWLVLGGSLVNLVEFITRSTGTWTLVWLWLTLAISPLKHFSGWSLPMRLRRELGLFSFFYACLHLLCYLWFDKFFDWPAILHDLLGRPFISIGTLAFILLLPLAITSTDGWIRRLKRNWARLHWLVYPAALASLLHYFLEVKLDLREPLQYALVLALLLGWRVYQRGYRRWRERQSASG